MDSVQQNLSGEDTLLNQDSVQQNPSGEDTLLNQDSVQQNPSGEDILVNIPLANQNLLLKVTTGASELALLCGCRTEDIGLLTSGELEVYALRNPLLETIAFLVCCLGGHYWPLGKDSTVLRVGPRRFCFSLPSILYGVTLPDGCTDDELKSFEQILKTFCTFEDQVSGSEFFTQGPGSRDFWASAYPSIKGTISATTSSLRAPSTTTAEVEAQPPSRETPISAAEPQRRNAMLLRRALRFSGITKMVVSTIVLDGVMKEEHIRLRGVPSASRPAVASIRAVADVMDVSDLLRHVNRGTLLPESNRRFPAETETYWTFAESGLVLMLRLVTAVGLLTA